MALGLRFLVLLVVALPVMASSLWAQDLQWLRSLKERSPIEQAIAYHDQDGLRDLIAADKRLINVHDLREGYTPLIMASKYSNLKAAEYLIAQGAKINARVQGSNQIQGSTALHWAMNNADVQMARTLLEAKADINVSDQHKITPLMLAIRSKSLQATELALQYGARLDVADYAGDTSLHYCSLAGQVNILQAVLEHARQRDELKLVDLTNEHGDTALNLAAEKHMIPVVRILIEAQANVNIHNAHKEVPLHFAAYTGYAPNIRALIEAGADVNVQDEHGWSPLDIALKFKHIEVIRLLKKQGAKPGNKNNKEPGKVPGTTPHKHPSNTVRL